MAATKKKKRHIFRIPIGDWSRDGHSQCDWFVASANGPIEDVREAYFTAKKIPSLKGCCPEDFCDGYEELNIPDELRTKMNKLGAPIAAIAKNADNYFGTDEMVDYVIWFINQGNVSLDVKRDETKELPTLTFYGYDNKKRHISCIGYGLFIS